MPHFFARELLKWHLKNPRPLPWADGLRNPYKIWLSEIILQQTRVEQGTPYYHRFVNAFPDVTDLATASLDQIMNLWQGLGYYTRARNLHKAAQKIVSDFNGIFPDTYDDLLSLPGIGPYSAAAISSFAFGLRYAVVDGNVKRLISRFAGITDSIDEQKTHEKIQAIASLFMKGVPPDVFNQAIMNFGALVCKPRPLCDICPLSKRCYAFLNHMTETLPVRSRKNEKTTRYFHYIVLHHRSKILFLRREGNDIWKGLYAPPIHESGSDKTPSTRLFNAIVLQYAGHVNFERIRSTPSVRQELSHQSIIGRFHHFRLLNSPSHHPDNAVWASKKTIADIGKPKMVAEMELLSLPKP